MLFYAETAENPWWPKVRLIRAKWVYSAWMLQCANCDWFESGRGLDQNFLAVYFSSA